MRVVALISGGKDSCYNMMQCIAAGHEIVALANLKPPTAGEADSYMYQTVGCDGIHLYSLAMDLPLFQHTISGNALQLNKEYSPTEGDEVEDLFNLLSSIKEKIHFDAVSVGAILSDYQRVRVENVCSRIGCTCLAFLWRRDQTELLKEMIDSNLKAVIVKTAALGLNPEIHLGQSIAQMYDYLIELKQKYGINVCGEGGEYETFTLDCPLFQKSIVIDEYEKVMHSNDAFAPVGYLKLKNMHLVSKFNEEPSRTSISLGNMNLEGIKLREPEDFLCDLLSYHIKDAGAIDEDEDAQIRIALEKTQEEDLHSELEDGDLKNETIVEQNSDPLSVPSDVSRIRETLPLPVSLRVSLTSNGWLWIMGVQGNIDVKPSPKISGDSVQAYCRTKNSLFKAMNILKDILEEKGGSMKDLIAVVLYVNDMSQYKEFNSVYNAFFESSPPIRICTEAPLPDNVGVLLDGVSYMPKTRESEQFNPRQYMHVQGISHWAPANIGPYSQAIWVGDIIYVAGQIGLVPGSMTLVGPCARTQCKLALRHVNRILKAVDSKVELRDVVQGICYVTQPKYIEECRREWEKRTNNAIVEYLVVPRLPKDAAVEWQIWAHKHNAAFEYEETGCFIGKTKVSIIKRWNYENKVAAIVCRSAISGEDKSLNVEEISSTVEYALSKLLQDTTVPSECSYKVFYRVGAVKPSDVFKSMEKASVKYTLAFSVLPVCGLINNNTVLSFCAVRHQ